MKHLQILSVVWTILFAGLIGAPWTVYAETRVVLDDLTAKTEHKDKTDSEMEEIIDGFDETPSKNQSNDSEDDILEGFEDDTPATATSPEKEIQQEDEFPYILGDYVSLDGFFKTGAVYNFSHHQPDPGETDWRGLSRFRSELQLELSTTFSDTWKGMISGKGFYDVAYVLNSRDDYTNAVLNHYEDEIELREAYIQGTIFKNLDIKIGRQIVVWGKSDSIRVTDVLNPLDLREPGLTDIEDLRLPVTMSRLDFYLGSWSLTGIALHEIRFNKNPEFGHDFYPATDPPPHEDKPEHMGKNTEWAVAINGIFSGWDVAFYWANFFDDNPYFHLKSFDIQLLPAPPPVFFVPITIPEFELKHARLTMYGAAFNVALGNWLLKAEGAYFEGLRFFNSPGKNYFRADVLAGVEYSGFTDTTITIEAANRYITNFDDVLELPPDEAVENEFQWVARVSRDFFNETLTIEWFASSFGIVGEDGALQRLSAEYDLTDDIKIIGGIVLYYSGDLARHRNIGDNDRVYLEVKYSF
jgi:hypothetical protein